MIFNFKSQMFEGTKKCDELLVRSPKIFSLNIKSKLENSHTVNAETKHEDIMSRLGFSSTLKEMWLRGVWTWRCLRVIQEEGMSFVDLAAQEQRQPTRNQRTKNIRGSEHMTDPCLPLIPRSLSHIT